MSDFPFSFIVNETLLHEKRAGILKDDILGFFDLARDDKVAKELNRIMELLSPGFTQETIRRNYELALTAHGPETSLLDMMEDSPGMDFTRDVFKSFKLRERLFIVVVAFRYYKLDSKVDPNLEFVCQIAAGLGLLDHPFFWFALIHACCLLPLFDEVFKIPGFSSASNSSPFSNQASRLMFPAKRRGHLETRSIRNLFGCPWTHALSTRNGAENFGRLLNLSAFFLPPGDHFPWIDIPALLPALKERSLSLNVKAFCLSHIGSTHRYLSLISSSFGMTEQEFLKARIKIKGGFELEVARMFSLVIFHCDELLEFSELH